MTPTTSAVPSATVAVDVHVGGAGGRRALAAASAEGFAFGGGRRLSALGTTALVALRTGVACFLGVPIANVLITSEDDVVGGVVTAFYPSSPVNTAAGTPCAVFGGCSAFNVTSSGTGGGVVSASAYVVSLAINVPPPSNVSGGAAAIAAAQEQLAQTIAACLAISNATANATNPNSIASALTASSFASDFASLVGSPASLILGNLALNATVIPPASSTPTPSATLSANATPSNTPSQTATASQTSTPSPSSTPHPYFFPTSVLVLRLGDTDCSFNAETAPAGVAMPIWIDE